MFSALFVALVLKCFFRQTKFWKLFVGSFGLVLLLNAAVIVEKVRQSSEQSDSVYVEQCTGAACWEVEQ